MRLDEFPLLADENIHAGVVEHLRAAGCEIHRVVDCGLAGKDDASILRRAVAEGRVVLTHDSDYGELAVARGEPLIGIVYLRPGHIEASFTIETLRHHRQRAGSCAAIPACRQEDRRLGGDAIAENRTAMMDRHRNACPPSVPPAA